MLRWCIKSQIEQQTFQVALINNMPAGFYPKRVILMFPNCCARIELPEGQTGLAYCWGILDAYKRLLLLWNTPDWQMRWPKILFQWTHHTRIAIFMVFHGEAGNRFLRNRYEIFIGICLRCTSSTTTIPRMIRGVQLLTAPFKRAREDMLCRKNVF